MMSIAILSTSSAEGELSSGTGTRKCELPPRPQSISDRRRISSTATSLLDDEEEERLDPGLMYESDDNSLVSRSSPFVRVPSPAGELSIQTKDTSSISIHGIAEGMSNLLCPASLDDSSPTDSPDTTRHDSETDLVQDRLSSGACGACTLPNTHEQLNSSQASLNVLEDTNRMLIDCTDMNLDALRQLVERDVNALLGTTGAATQWVLDLNSWLVDGMNSQSRKMRGSSRNAFRNRCGVRNAQAQRLQRLWHDWHSNTGEAMTEPSSVSLDPFRCSEDPNRPPLPIWSIAVTRSLDDAECANAARATVVKSTSVSRKQVATIDCASTPPTVPPRKEESVPTELYYDSDPEVFRHASRKSYRRASASSLSPKNKPIRQRRQISIPHGIDTVASVGSRDYGSPPTPRNHLGKGFPSFDMPPSFDHYAEMSDEDAVHEFLKDLTLQKTKLVWHPSPDAKGTTKENCSTPSLRSPVSVQAWFELGSRLPGALVQPKFMWRETYQPDLVNHKRLGCTYRKPDSLELLSMIRIKKPVALDRSIYPFAKLDQTFTILTHTNQFLVFEASSSHERDWLVHGLKLAVARLASMIIVGDDQMFVEFFSPWVYAPSLEDSVDTAEMEEREVHATYGEGEQVTRGPFISTTDREREDLWGFPR